MKYTVLNVMHQATMREPKVFARDDKLVKGELLHDYLNKMAQEGWRVVGVTGLGQYFIVILERQMPDI